MPAATISLPASFELPFKYIGGDPSLDLVNTIDWTSRGPEAERLSSYERLTRWAEDAGVLGKREADQLRAQAAARPAEARRVCEEARELRAVLQRLFGALARGERPATALVGFNTLLTEALARLSVEPVERRRKSGRVAEWAWRGRGEDLRTINGAVLWSAATLLTSDEAARLRVCGGPDCGWMYVDRSRNGLRRWCQMETCGTRAKSRRRAERSRRSQ